jgi:hypothetical protein
VFVNDGSEERLRCKTMGYNVFGKFTPDPTIVSVTTGDERPEHEAKRSLAYREIIDGEDGSFFVKKIGEIYCAYDSDRICGESCAAMGLTGSWTDKRSRQWVCTRGNFPVGYEKRDER